MKRWTNKEFDKAAKMLNDGYDYVEIAYKLDRTPKAVKVKLSKSGLTYMSVNPGREKRECKNCNKEFETIISDPKRFCGSSCAATFNNKSGKIGRQLYKKKKENHSCLNCNSKLGIDNKKYCNRECQNEFNKKEKFKLIENGDTSLYYRWYKKYLINKHGAKCMKCGWCERNEFSGNIPIELEHRDGNSENNSLDNLELLCPNCHSLTPTYRTLNIGKGRHKRRKRYSEGKSF